MSSILLVEDSPTQAMQMKLLLESAAHEVTCCDDGVAAMEYLAGGTNELVVTDLELPVMNGLELIKKMAAEFPHIPAVLVTGHGSERLAAEALRVGATAYVPKSLLDDMLLGTVEDIVGVMRSDLSYAELIDCTVENRLVFELPNKPPVVMAAIDLTMQLATGMQLLSGVDGYRVGNALRHAASNAMFRGNLELTREQWQQGSVDVSAKTDSPIVVQRMEDAPYKNRKIHFDVRLMRDLIRVVIRDEGPGFKAQEIFSADHARALDESHGRGLVLIRNFMDKVTFNDAGNEITLIKHCTKK